MGGEQVQQRAPENAQPSTSPEQPKSKNGLAAVLSFFIPGLGQLIKGHTKRGIIIFVAAIISAFLIFSFIGLITTPILWLWNIYDAYKLDLR